MSETAPEQASIENEAIRTALSTPDFVEETRRGAAHLLRQEVEATEIQDAEGGN